MKKVCLIVLIILVALSFCDKKEVELVDQTNVSLQLDFEDAGYPDYVSV